VHARQPEAPGAWVPAASVLGWLALTGAAYGRGWWDLHTRSPSRFPAWRLTAFLAGLGSIALAVASPLDAAADRTLAAHMVQHLVLLVVAPLLLLAGAPLVPIARGLPRWLARGVVRPVLRSPLPRVLTRPLVGWLTVTLAVWAWHVPAAFELALHSDLWHAAEHACFLFGGVLFWWPVVLPWPSQPCMPHWALLPYLLLADLQNTALAAILAFATHPLYPTYALLLGPRALDDQVLAGVLMWVPMSLVYLVPAAVVTARLLAPQRGRRAHYQLAGEAGRQEPRAATRARR
jgi:putative membrane protein